MIILNKKMVQVKLAIIYVLLGGSVCAQSFPDPNEYGKLLVETIKTNDSLMYIHTFMPTDMEINSVFVNCAEYPYQSDFHKDELLGLASKSQNWMKERCEYNVQNSFQTLKSWLHSNNIDVNKLSYEKIFVELEYKKHDCVPKLDNLYILISYEKQLFLIEAESVFLFNNKWKGGAIQKINEVSQDLKIVDTTDNSIKHLEQYIKGPSDPMLFANKVIEAIQTKDSAKYVQNLLISKNDFDLAIDSIISFEHLPEHVKIELNGYKESVEGIMNEYERIEVGVSRSYTLIEQWIKEYKVNVKNLELYAMFYEIKQEDGFPLYVLDDTYLILTDGKGYYFFKYANCIGFNNTWYAGKLRTIIEVDEFLNKKEEN